MKKDFTEMTESQAIVALNKEIQRKNEQIEWLQKQANFARQQIQLLSGHTNEAQFNCNTCG